MKDIREVIRNNKNYQSETLRYLGLFLSKDNKVSKLANLGLNLTRKALGKKDAVNSGVPSVASNDLFHVYQSAGEGMPSLDMLSNLIRDRSFKVVSFDIFDTLLCRAAINPSDIFHVVGSAVDKEYGIDFAAVRMRIEPRLNNPYATIDDIYDELGKVTGLSCEAVVRIKETELEVERRLLFPREEMVEMYNLAVQEGKRIIATSDMYLPSAVLLDILHEKGYGGIEKVYVSCENGCRKDQYGSLFDKVMEEEGISRDELLHVGDNENSDYAYPVRKGICAFWYPSVIDQIYRNDTLWRRFYPDRFSEFGYGVRVVYGFLFNKYGKLITEKKSGRMYKDAYEFGLFGLGPVLLITMLSMLQNKEIQDGYKKIYFASRDGYLPQKVYELLRENFNSIYNSEYIVCDEFTADLLYQLKERNNLKEIEQGVCLYTNNICQIIHPLDELKLIVKEGNLIGLNLKMTFMKSPYCEFSIFDDISNNIIFEGDSLLGHYDNELRGSGFLNPENYFFSLPDIRLNLFEKKIGIHLHLYDISFYLEILEYFKQFPYSFDLYITTCKKENIELLEKAFKSNIPMLKHLDIILVPNRGRDVAPWLIEIKNIQYKYDFFCHVHGKKSSYIGIEGDLWRQFLFKNLLNAKSVTNILNLFFIDESIGMIFPAGYKDICMNYIYGVPLVGENKLLMETLAKKMNLSELIQRRYFFFSVGTMLWYRPICLKTLFNVDFKYEDFPEEPIKLDGTYAHAVERLIYPVCASTGYRTVAMTLYEGNKSLSCMFL